jgi:hypothetical protein
LRASRSPGRDAGRDEVARLTAATHDGVVLDRLLPKAPVRESTLWGPVPQLLQAVRALEGRPSYVRAEPGRRGRRARDAPRPGAADGAPGRFAGAEARHLLETP